jgi:Carboxypeptidase regulatory-like domain
MGTVVDQTGEPIAGAQVKLSGEGPSSNQQTITGDDGQFAFTSVPRGSFHLTISSAGLATQTVSGVLDSGEFYRVPQITLRVASAATEMRVGLTPMEVSEDEIKDQEKQRVLGFVPNFYVSYVPKAVPLSSKQKFELAWKTTVDPVSFGVTGFVAGIQQATDEFGGYGQGAQGYAKRYGASYADLVTSTFLGSAILPSLLKQDPRYFYKGTGTRRSRILYALANAVICKGDNGHWQPNYSGILGSLAAGGISNLYYPSSDREGVELTFENSAIGIASTAGVNLLQEFVIRKLTPKLPQPAPANP